MAIYRVNNNRIVFEDHELQQQHTDIPLTEGVQAGYKVVIRHIRISGSRRYTVTFHTNTVDNYNIIWADSYDPAVAVNEYEEKVVGVSGENLYVSFDSDEGRVSGIIDYEIIECSQDATVTRI